MPEIIPNLHPLFVHFPIALVSLSALFHIAAIAIRSQSCATHCANLAHTTLWLGALAALPTVFFGWQAFNSVNHDDASHAAMLVHRTWALGTLAALVVLAGWDVWRNKIDAIPSKLSVIAVIGVWGMVTVTAWHGGELVYRHGLGVMALPKVESEPHGHGHADYRDPENIVQEHTHELAHGHSHDKHAQ